MSSPTGKKEFSMEMRLLLAFILMGAVLFVTQLFYKPEPPPASAKKQTPASASPAAAPAVTPVSQPKKADAKTEPAPAVAAQKEENFVVETDVYRVVLSNRGAIARSWLLKKYRDNNGKPLELINTAAADKVGYPFSLVFKNQKPSADVNSSLYE